ncbi:hypothetical protein Trydic_g18344 [Trypoxylus dichotomus]
MYRAQFEAAARANGWLMPEGATALVVALRGAAVTALQPCQKLHNRIMTPPIRKPAAKTGIPYPATYRDVEEPKGTPAKLWEQQAFLLEISDIEVQQTIQMGRHRISSDTLIYALEVETAKQA